VADFLLIHGGTTTGSYWDRLCPLLRGQVLAPDLPGRRARLADLMNLTVDDCVAAACDDIDGAELGDRVVVMAHSSGGLCVPGAARHLGSRCCHIVLSSASVPPDGGTALDCMKPRHAEGVRAVMAHARETGAAVTTLDGAMRDPDPERIRVSYGGDPLPDELVSFMADPERRVPDSFNVYFQPVSWAGVPEVGITWIKNLRDRAIPVDLQEEMIGRLPRPPRVVEIDGGHIPSVTRPEAVATVLNALAEE
jgi:pimeloyl-ACP methyl ester carboxylesterase